MASEGFNHIPQALEAIQRGIREGIAQAAKRGAQLAANDAPRDTGYMAGHVYYATLSESSYQDGEKNLPEVTPEGDDEALFASAATYSDYVENGTRYMPAQPWFYPASDTLHGELPRILTDAITAALKDALK